MPLHGDGKAKVCTFHGLNHAVGGDSRNSQPPTHLVQRLMMARIDLLRARPHDCRQLRARFHFNGVRGEAGAGQSHAVRLDVLMQGATGMNDIEQLHAAADGQHGQVSIEGLPQQPSLHLIPRIIRLVGFHMRRLVVQLGVDVATAAQQEAVETLDGVRRPARVQAYRFQAHLAQRFLVGPRFFIIFVGDTDSVRHRWIISCSHEKVGLMNPPDNQTYAPPLPIVVIVGRPNVGKSTLFNLIVGSRRSIVGDEPGITRDRIHAEAEHAGKRFEVIDTGGIIPNDEEMIPSEILRHARVALESADHIIFLIDGRTEITGADRDLAKMLHKLGKPVALAVNKIDSPSREDLAMDFHAMGFRHVFAISAEHRIGVEELLDQATSGFPQSEDAQMSETPRIAVAIIGRPNAGKSTLLNTLTGKDRSIVTPEAGTTRDAVDESIVHDGIEYAFVDTAGIRRKGKTRMMAEKLSVVMARRHIRMADVVLMLIDAEEGVVGLDATIAGYAHEGGRPVIICVNKWDIAKGRNKIEQVKKIRDAMKYLEYAPVAFLSAKDGGGVKQLFGLILRGHEAANRRVTTGELNRFFERLEKKRDFNVRYITQASVRPPTFVVFKDGKQPLHFSNERFLINQIREMLNFEGTPIVIKTRSKNRKK